MGPAEVFVSQADITLNAAGAAVKLRVANSAARPVHAGNRYHVAKTKSALDIDSALKGGCLLDITALSVQSEPVQTREVNREPEQGTRTVRAVNNAVMRSVD